MQVVCENQLTFFRPTEFSIKFDTIMSGWSIVYIGVSQVIYLKPKVTLHFELLNISLLLLS